VNERVVWVSGTGGTWGLTTDGGATWHTAVVPEADSLEFRDVHGVDERTAYVLAAGPGAKSRIYHTVDAGTTWQLQFRNSDTLAFYDCFAFWNARAGLAFSDAVQGQFPLIRTADGGRHWYRRSGLPPASDGEGAFAASGTCVTTFGDSLAWIATGAGPLARVLRTRNRGVTWRAVRTPMAHGTPTRGHTGIAFRTARDGIAVGGDLGDTATVGMENVILTADGGATWTLGGALSFAGAAYGVALVPGGTSAVAVGPRGASWSTDGGQSWQPLDSLSHWSVGFASARAGWMVGPAGRITKITIP
jgi:photosystem II stability/assembly factor-like uncharacterized protein